MDKPWMKYKSTLELHIKNQLEKLIGIAELLGLLTIGICTVLAMGHVIWEMIGSRQVTLTDLLLIFLYLEVFAMVGQYLNAGQLPVRFPLYIAMVSIARDLILRAGVNSELHVLASCGSIVLLAVGVLVIRYGQNKYPSDRPNQRGEGGA